MSKYYGNSLVFLFMLVFFSSTVLAVADIGPRVGQSVTGSMRLINGTTLAHGDLAIQLAGIKLISPENDAQAQLLLQKALSKGLVTCTILAIGPKPADSSKMQLAQGNCTDAAQANLGFPLLENGLVQVVKEQLATEADTLQAFLTLERQMLKASEESDHWPEPLETTPSPSNGNNPFSLIYTALVILGAVIVLLAIGMVVMFKRLTTRMLRIQQAVMTRDKKLLERERYVIAAALDGEINTNHAKLSAFMLVYEELLKSLRDPTKKPKYQKTGDVIHEKPTLMRSIYDANTDKLSILGGQLANDLNNLYTKIEANPGYRTLEPETPLADVIDLLERIVNESRPLLTPMEKISGALGIILRDKRDS